MGRLFIATSLLIAVSLPSSAQTVRAPQLTPGDSWTYANMHEVRGIRRVTHDIATLTRVDSRMLAVEAHPVGLSTPGPERLFGPDWSRIRSVNGRQTVVNQPLSYPLTPGKSWTIAYSETTPANRAHTREDLRMTYKVVGWEDVTVAAGTFRAVRIEGDGTWTADLPSNTLLTRGRAPNGVDVATATRQAARVASGRFLKSFWYVPEVHRWVKSQEDFFDSNGVRTEQTTSELEAFTLADPHAAEAEIEEPAAPPPVKHAKAHHAVAAKKPVKPPHPAPAASPLQETRATALGSHSG